MIEWEPIETLSDGPYTVIKRCRRTSDGAMLITKRLLDKVRNAQRIARFKREYELLISLERNGARHTPKPVELICNSNEVILITYDIGGVSLDRLRKTASMTVLQILTVATRVCQALVDVHASGVVHKDLNPNHILVSPTGEVQLIDFGLAVHTARNEGLLTHTAPEQTGRLQVSLDRRIDFYGLGATLYDLLTGRPPVLPGERDAMIHDLLTARPPAPRELAPTLPDMVERLVLKLLNKNPDARYSSAYGLLRDLEHCLRAWELEARIEPFELAQHDRLETLQWPDETLGRQDDIERIIAAAEPRALGSVRTCMVAAEYGMGKTAVIRDAASKIRDRFGGLVAYAPYDEAAGQVGMYGMARAIDGLVRQMLRGTPPEMEAWRRRIQTALGSIGYPLAQLVPVLTALVGDQPKLTDLGPRESENRLLTCLQRVCAAIAEHTPLILCVDDVHRADAATLKFLQQLRETFAGPGTISLMLAYDPQQVSPRTTIGVWLYYMKKLPDVSSIQMSAMTVEQVAELLQQVLAVEHEEVLPLARVVHNKTHGKSGAVRALMEGLWHDGVVTFDVRRARWVWDSAKVSLAQVTDDVASYAITRLAKLPLACQELLGMAACMGARFDLSLLQAIADDPQATWAQLAAAVEEGMLTAPDRSGYVQFTHEKVRLQARAALSVARMRSVHRAVALYMQTHRPETPWPAWTCALADHINAARSDDAASFTNVDTALANIDAASAAYKGLSYSATIGYAEKALASLGESAWKEHMALAQSIIDLKYFGHLGMGDIASADATVSMMLDNCTEQVHRVWGLGRKAAFLWTCGESVKSLETSIRRFHMAGQYMPRNPGFWALLWQRLRFAWVMWSTGQTIESLANKPFVEDAQQVAIMSMLRNLLLASSLVRPRLLLWIAWRLGELSARWGIEKQSPGAFSALLMQAARENRRRTAERWAGCLRRLAERSESAPGKAYVELVILQQLEGLARHPRYVVDRMEAVAQVLADHGDYGSAIWAYVSQATLLTSISIEEATRFLEQKSTSAALIVNAVARDQMDLIAAHAKEFRLGARDESRAIGKRGFLPVLDWILAIEYHLARGHLEQAYIGCQSLAKIPYEVSTSQLLIAWQAGIICVACTRYIISTGGKKRLPSYFYKAYKQLRLTCDFEGSVLTGSVTYVDAELAAMAGDYERAGALYEKACLSYDASGLASLQAFSNETAGRFFASRGLVRASRAFLDRACNAHAMLGSTYRSAELRREFGLNDGPSLLEDAQLDESDSRSTHILVILRTLAESMAGDYNRTSLAAKICARVGDIPGAGRVVVSLGDKGANDHVIHDSAGFGASSLPAFLNAPETRNTPMVGSAPETVAGMETVFAYVPIMHRARVVGWMYCESNDPEALAPRLLPLLELLVGQAALGVENAAVYQRLEAEVEARTRDERQAKEQLFEVAHDHAELHMAAGFAHEIRNAAASARFALGAAYSSDPDSTTTVFDESRAALEHAMAAHQMWAASGGQDAAAREALLAHLKTLLASREASRPLMQSISESIARAMSVTTQVLEYARAGHLMAGDHKSAIGGILADLLKDIRGDLEARGVQLQLDVDPGLQLPMREDHAFAILRNLLVNARDAVCDKEAASRQHRIVLSAKTRAPNVVVSVVDSGVGMSVDDQKHVFQPFFTTKGARGTGLGLGLSRKLARLYGGDLQFASTRGEGTTFTLCIPTAR